MKVQVEELSPIERKLSIEVESTVVDSELARAYSQLGTQVKIPGFRPGKIPRRILEQRFRTEVESDVLQRVVQKGYLEAIRQNNVEAVSDPQVTPQQLKPGEPFSFEARVEVKPKLEPKDYKGLELKKTEVNVADEAVQKRLDELRQRMTSLEPVTGRDVAQANDYAVVDYDATIDGKPFEGGKAENTTVHIAPGELVQGNIPALEGMKVGETKQIDYAFPADFPDEKVKGKVAQFKVALKSLKTEVVPELNDDFAKEVGGGNSLDELRKKVREDLERSEKGQAEQKDRDALVDALIAKNPFEVPKGMVERVLDMMLDNVLRQFARSGIDPRQLNLDFRSIREEMRERAVREVKGTLLFEAIADAEKIEASEEELDKKIEQLAAESNQAVSQVAKAFRSPSDRKSLGLRVREEKTIEFLKAAAKY